MKMLPPIDDERLIDRLVQLLRTPSPTGDTRDVLALLDKWLRAIGLAPELNNKGALIVTLEGRSAERPRAVTGHVDTLGAIVSQVKASGRLAFDRIGGYPLHSINGEYCTIMASDGRRYTGTAVLVKSSTHVHREQVKDKDWKPEEVEIRLDAVVRSAAETRGLGIEVGDMVAWDPRTALTEGGFIKSRHLDDKAGVAAMLEALQALAAAGETVAQRTTFHFSNYEEVGHGAAAGLPGDVHELVAVDMGALGDGLQGTEQTVSICAKDSGGPYDLGLRRRLVELAKASDIPFTVDIYPYYGSDAEAALRAGGNHRIGLFGPGVDASHATERTHTSAVRGSAQLLLAYLMSD